MRILLKCISLMKSFRIFVFLAIFLGWTTTISWFALITTSAYLISAAALHPSVAELQVAIVGVRFFGLSRAVSRYFERLVSHTVTFKLLANIRVWFYDQLEPLAPAGLQEYRTGDLLSRILADVEVLQEFYVRVFGPTVVAITTSLSVFWFFGHWSIQFAFVLILFHILIGIVLPFSTRWISKKASKQIIQVRSNISVLAVDAVQGSSEIILFGQETAFHEKVVSTIQEGIKAEKRINLIESLSSSIGLVGINLTAFVLLFLTIPIVNSGNLDGKILAVIILGAIASFEAIQPLSLAYQNLEKAIEAGRRIFEIIDRPPSVSSGTEQLPDFNQPLIEIKHLDFSYSQKRVLHDITLTLPFGKKTAIVGLSGSGKTTLSNLIMRFWDFKEGEILINGKDIRSFEEESIRNMVAYVPQDAFIFNSTIAENIRIGKPAATDPEIQEAARKANLDQFILSLPKRYQTIVGEGGAFLSGGERQRISVARAAVRNAPIYIFDEPFSNLDQATVKSVYHAITELVQDKSMLLISHQLTNLALMDEIILLRDGAILERGTQQELISISGAYRKMYDLQQNLINA